MSSLKPSHNVHYTLKMILRNTLHYMLFAYISTLLDIQNWKKYHEYVISKIKKLTKGFENSKILHLKIQKF